MPSTSRYSGGLRVAYQCLITVLYSLCPLILILKLRKFRFRWATDGEVNGESGVVDSRGQRQLLVV